MLTLSTFNYIDMVEYKSCPNACWLILSTGYFLFDHYRNLIGVQLFGLVLFYKLEGDQSKLQNTNQISIMIKQKITLDSMNCLLFGQDLHSTDAFLADTYVFLTTQSFSFFVRWFRQTNWFLHNRKFAMSNIYHIILFLLTLI